MSTSTKLQQYKYSLRSTAIAPRVFPNGYMCNYRFIVYPVPPDNAITIENLYLHLKVLFSVSVASGSRKIARIGIGNNYPLYGNNPTRWKYYDVNIAADPTTRIAEAKIDLSALLKKDDVRWADYFNHGDPSKTGFTYIIIDLPSELVGSGTNGDLILCKMDALYTTTGIQ
jgi:hypothetical protein